jgi:hypothetical protein
MAILFPFSVNWKSSFTKTLSYKTEVLVSRDKTEERFAARSQPRTALDFDASPMRTDVAKAAALLFKDLQGEFIVPESPTFVRATTDRVLGFDSFIVADPAPFWIAAGLWVVVTTSAGLEAFLVVSVATGTVTIAGTLAGDMTAGAKVYPGLVGRLDQGSKVNLMTTRAANFPVTFNADPGATNYRAQGFPPSPDHQDGRVASVTTPLNTTTYFSLAQLGLTAESVDLGTTHLSVHVHADWVGVGLGVGMTLDGYTSAHVAFYADNGSGSHATTALPGGTYDASGTTSTSGDRVLTLLIKPGTRHIGFHPQAIATIPFYTSVVYSIQNEYYILPVNDSYQKFYRDTPILVIRPNWSANVNLTGVGNLETVDYSNGPVENYSFLTWNSITTQAVFMRRDAAEVERLEALFNEVHGQHGEFYMPTWLEDFDVTTGTAAGTTTLQTPGLTLFQSYAGSEFHKAAIVFWRDGTFQINPVVSIAGAGLNSLTTFGNVWDQAINPGNVYMMCWLPRCRFMIDTLTLEYLTDNKVTTQLTYKILKELT